MPRQPNSPKLVYKRAKPFSDSIASSVTNNAISKRRLRTCARHQKALKRSSTIPRNIPLRLFLALPRRPRKLWENETASYEFVACRVLSAVAFRLRQYRARLSGQALFHSRGSRQGRHFESETQRDLGTVGLNRVTTL